MSEIHAKNGGYITTSIKPTLSRSRGGSTTSTNFWVSYNDAHTSIIDRSSSAITVTNGGAVYNAATPYSGTNKGSIYFDTATDYVNATNAAFTLGTGDFTIMTWVNITSIAGYCGLFEGSTSGGGRISSMVWLIQNTAGGGQVGIFQNGNWQFLNTTVVPFNTWVHLALVRSSGTTKLYINGTYDTQTTSVMNITTNFCQISKIGDATGCVAKFAGYNLFKGIALYTGNFTPPSVNEDLGSISVTSTANTTTYGVYKLGY